jgi:tetratricopeptide (TPR) repeat protein
MRRALEEVRKTYDVIGRCKEHVMVHRKRSFLTLAFFVGAALVATALVAEENANPGQEKLDKATEVKIAAETAADLNEVITLAREAIAAGLDESNKSFANELLSSTLTQRADLICSELFEQPLRPSRARRLVEMAMTDLQETLAIDANQSLAQYLIGRLHAHLGEKDKALAAINEAVRLSSEDNATQAQALLVRANLRDDAAERTADFDKAVELTPHDPEVFRYRGMYHLGENRAEKALADFDAALALDPDDGDTHEARGLAQSVLQKYDDAMESFNKAIEQSPDSATAHTHRARVRAIKGDTPAALKDVEHALELQPGSVQALQLHAALLGSTGKFDKALKDLNLLRTAMPDNAELLLQIATLYQASKQVDKAIDAYGDVLEADPANIGAFRGRADAYLSQGKQAEAVADYDKALESDPKNSGVLNNLAWVLATSPDDKLRNGQRAIELATTACEVTEYKQAHILSTLAASYAETGDFDKAKEWSQKAVDLGADEMKGQLRKELESYEAKKPWREEMPPDLVAEPAADEAEGSKPANGETARSKPGR